MKKIEKKKRICINVTTCATSNEEKKNLPQKVLVWYDPPLDVLQLDYLWFWPSFEV
jgi:hypothetical protein